MPRRRWCPVVWSVLLGLSTLQAQPVVKCPTPSLSLRERLKWALTKADASVTGSSWLVGYSFQRLMNANSFIGSRNESSFQGDRGDKLADLLTGVKTDWSREQVHEAGNDHAGIFKVRKDVAVLLQYRRSSTGTSLEKVQLSTADLSVDLDALPLFWLDGASDEESVQELAGLFRSATTAGLKKEIVTGIGIHQRSEAAFPFLEGVVRSQQPDEVRSQAAFWLGESNDPRAVAVLKEVALTDNSAGVREQAVFALSLPSAPESTQALIDLALNAKNAKVRSQAAFWLGQEASQKVVATLETIVSDDADTEVQRQALYALSRIHDKEGINRLIRIAEHHPNPRIRKAAIQCLGQSDDPQALKALVDIIRK